MTFFSNWIEARQQPDFGERTVLAKPFATSDSRYSPYELEDWAKGLGLPITYVDRCWLKVHVTGEQLRHFLIALGDRLAPEAAAKLSQISSDGSYVIVAEEF